jgi:membrane protease YdiL (CAAX protease family)
MTSDLEEISESLRGANTSRVPTWHFASLILFFLLIALHPGSKSLFSLIHIRGSASVIFTVVIILNVVLTLYAIWGLRLSRKKHQLLIGQNSSWQTRAEDSLIGLALGIGLMAISIFWGMLFPDGRSNIAPEIAKSGFDRVLELTTYVVVSFCEEIQFRGYFLRQLVALTCSTNLAIVLQALFFVFMHGSGQGLSGYLARFVFGGAFGLIAIQRKSLWPSITAHLLINITAFIVGQH